MEALLNALKVWQDKNEDARRRAAETDEESSGERHSEKLAEINQVALCNKMADMITITRSLSSNQSNYLQVTLESSGRRVFP